MVVGCRMSKEEIIIDPPVGIGSSSVDILAWIDDLEKMPKSELIEFELVRARRLLEKATREND